MRIAVSLMSMDSAPGYVSSYGYQEAILVSAEKAVKCGGDSEALFDLEGSQITEEMLSDIEHRSSGSGVLRYSWTSGVFDCPEGHVVVQKLHENICTRDEPTSEAWVVNEKSVLNLYRERAEEYNRRADELDD